MGCIVPTVVHVLVVNPGEVLYDEIMERPRTELDPEARHNAKMARRAIASPGKPEAPRAIAVDVANGIDRES